MEKKELAAVHVSVPVVTEKQLNEFLDISGVGRNLAADKRRQFVEIAKAYGLNPFKREIYCVAYGGQTSIITGYEVYIKRAERTGKLDGWKVEVEGQGNDMKAIITIYRNDWKQPFKHEAYFEEAANRTKDGELNSVWKKMPRFMLKKVAIAQGFRLCFSDELGGMPYTGDELGVDEKKQQVEAKPAANKHADAVEAVEILELPQDVLNALAQATSKAQLKQICVDVVKALGDAYRETLNDYYRKHAGALGA